MATHSSHSDKDEMPPAPWADQDRIWYGSGGKDLKGHVQLIVRKLNKLCEKGDWIWPTLVDDGYKAVADYLMKFLSLPYSQLQIKEIVNSLHARHVVFTKLLAKQELTWVHENNEFKAAKPEVWDALLKEEPRFGWYRKYGEPLWSELACIFDGWSYWHKEYAENPDCMAADWEQSDPDDDTLLKDLIVKDSEDESSCESSSDKNNKSAQPGSSTGGEFGSRKSAFRRFKRGE